MLYETWQRTQEQAVNMTSIRAGIEASYQDGFCSALIGLYSFSGCDSISSIAGKGKVKAINLLKKHPEFIEDFEELGQTCIVTEKQIVNLKRFVPHPLWWSASHTLSPFSNSARSESKPNPPRTKMM